MRCNGCNSERVGNPVMDLRLYLVNRQNRDFDREIPLAVTTTGVTLGRNPGNDLVLEDPERVVSGQHARLDLRHGGLWLTDTSRNGTFLNRAAEPVPSHQAVALYDGDSLAIGPYEIQVRIQDAAGPPADPAPSAVDPLPGLEQVGPATDILDLLGPSDPPRGGSGQPAPPGLGDDPFADALSLDEMLAGPAPESPPRGAPLHHTPVEHVFYQPRGHQPVPDDYDLLSDAWRPAAAEPAAGPARVEPEPDVARDRSPGPVGEPAPAVCEEPPDSDPSPALAPRPQPPRRPEPSRPPAPPPQAPPVAASRGRELDAFLAGLGAGRASAVDDPELLLRQAGELVSALATGLARTLMGRAQFKSELRLGVTTIRAAENNPFKFSVGSEELFDRLLLRPNPGFLPGPTAAREAFEDIQAHEMAITAGLQAALRALLARFEPAALERRLGASSGLDQLLKGRKAKYWDLFTETYQQVAADASEDFMRLFGDAFARAYQEQIERLRAARE